MISELMLVGDTLSMFPGQIFGAQICHYFVAHICHFFVAQIIASF
jgi:uncharacterized membrane protein YhhN